MKALGLTNNELYRSRLNRFRRHSIYVLLSSVVYALLVIQFTPLFKDIRYPLEFFILFAGSINFIVYQYLPDKSFNPNVGFWFNLIGLFTTTFVIHISGGLNSPFIFLYTIIILSALVSMNIWRAMIVFVLVIELYLAHYFISPNRVIFEPGSVQDLFFLMARLVILTTYVGLLVKDLFSEESKNQDLILKLQDDLAENRLSSELDRSIASRQSLSETLTKTLEQTALQLKAELGLILLRDDLSNSWRARATYRLTHEFTSKINPEMAESQIMKTFEKNKKTTLLSKAEAKKALPSLEPLGISSVLVSPLIFNGRLFGSIVLVNLDADFTNEDKEFLDRLASKFSVTVSNALSLEAQDSLFLRNEKELEEIKRRLSASETKQEKKKTLVRAKSH